MNINRTDHEMYMLLKYHSMSIIQVFNAMKGAVRHCQYKQLKQRIETINREIKRGILT